MCNSKYGPIPEGWELIDTCKITVKLPTDKVWRHLINCWGEPNFRDEVFYDDCFYIREKKPVIKEIDTNKEILFVEPFKWADHTIFGANKSGGNVIIHGFQNENNCYRSWAFNETWKPNDDLKPLYDKCLRLAKPKKSSGDLTIDDIFKLAYEMGCQEFSTFRNIDVERAAKKLNIQFKGE